MIKKQEWIMRSSALGRKAKYHLMQAIFNSKWTYGSEILSIVNVPYRTWLRSQWYRSLKTLLGISAKVSSSLILEKCLGMAWCCWQSRRNARTLRKQGITRDPRLCDHALNLPNLEEGKVRPPI